MQTPYSGLPRTVISDGHILGEHLQDIGLTRAWLMAKLAEQNVYNQSRVMLAQVDTSGNLYVDFEDKEKSKDGKQVLLGEIERIHNELYRYHLEADNPGDKEMFKACRHSVEGVLDAVRGYLGGK